MERVQRDEEQLDRAVPVVRRDMIPHAPVTEKAIGRTLTIRQLMQAAVEVSDNPAANILIRENGWNRRMACVVADLRRHHHRDFAPGAGPEHRPA